MEQPPRVDNEDVLFSFDPFELAESPSDQGSFLSSFNLCSYPSSIAVRITDTLSNLDILRNRHMEPGGQDDPEPSAILGKGKGPSLPMPIPAPFGRDSSVTAPTIESPLEGTSSSSQLPFVSITGEHNIISLSPDKISILGPEDRDIQLAGSSSSDDCVFMNASLPGKGKAKDLAYTLPPLLFSTSDVQYRAIDWPSPDPGSPAPTAGPSSYGSTHTSPPCASSHSDSQSPENSAQQLPGLTRVPSRRRSLSNLSIHSTRSLAARSMSRIKVKLGSASKGTGNLARRLLFRNKASAATTSVDLSPAGSVSDPFLGDLTTAGQRNCLPAWKNPEFQPCLNVELPSDARTHVQQSSEGPESPNSITGKGRSYSSPLSQSVFDIVPRGNSDVFAPVPLVLQSVFDDALPRELKLQIFSALISLHEDEFQLWKSSGQWTTSKASSSKYRWVGRDRGMRELVKLSRVRMMYMVLRYLQ